MHKNVFAYTENTSPYPAYVSLNSGPSVGTLRLTVRGVARPGQYSDKDEGPNAEIDLPRDELAKLYHALHAELSRDERA